MFTNTGSDHRKNPNLYNRGGEEEVDLSRRWSRGLLPELEAERGRLCYAKEEFPSLGSDMQESTVNQG